MIYKANGDIALTPVYDILCTCVYGELDSKIAIKVGRSDFIEKVTLKDWYIFAKQLDVNPNFAEQALKTQIKLLPVALEKIGYEILDFVSKNCAKAKKRFGF